MSNSTTMGAVSNWAGYLLKTGNTQFPAKYIKLDTYEITPDQREEVKAWRDDYSRTLYRLTASGMKTKISFEVPAILTLAESFEIQNWFYTAETDHVQRKLSITYWNTEYFRYDTGLFYRADTNFQIRQISTGDMEVKGHKIILVEY